MACNPRFVILSSMRTGSHYLATSLDTHSALHVAGEITYRPKDYGIDGNAPMTAKQAVATIFDSWNGFIQHRNPAFFSMGLNKVSLWSELLTDRELKVINLKRHNILATIASLASAISSGIFQIQAPDAPSDIISAERDKWCSLTAPQPKVFLASHVVGYRVQELLGEYNEFDRVIPVTRRLDVWYEDLVEDYHGTCCRVQEYLGLRVEELQPSTLKQENRPLTEVIENYHQAKQIVDTLVPDAWKNARSK